MPAKKLETLFSVLDWPDPKDVWEPKGAAALTLARLAQDKIERPLKRLMGEADIRVGVLTRDPDAVETQPLLALVCAFGRPAPQAALRLAHSLAWNFNRTKLLITIEPHLIRSWTCWERPKPDDEEELRPVFAEEWDQHLALEHAATRALHIAYLATGAFFERYQGRFDFEQRADQLLLRNLSALRAKLLAANLAVDIVHDLIARLIFIQFLHQRKDGAGNPALNGKVFEELQQAGVLTTGAENLVAVLESHTETYSLFHWLNERFNGDLFPGKGATKKERKDEWRSEMAAVTPEHLQTLADFISGDLLLNDGQHSLWPLYSFDTIPLEIISSIYEQFVSDSPDSIGAHYTPPFVVDFILDRVLPWRGERYDFKIFDPSCGSGIFLVKSFQRLVQRWRYKHPQQEPSIEFLIDLLKYNLFGVDINPHAIRVASFSLYLALCEEIDPKRLWQEVRFPRLRDTTLFSRDYFEAPPPASADVIVGNAPWGKNTVTPAAEAWAKENQWPVENRQIGSLFLAKASAELGEAGHISLLQPAATILFNRGGPATELRRLLTSRLDLLEVADFSGLRFSMFANSVSPVCLVTARSGSTTGSFMYIRPRPDQNPEASSYIEISPADAHELLIYQFLNEPWILPALAWGSARAASLLDRLIAEGRTGRLLTLSDLKSRVDWRGREGYKRGNRKKKKTHLANGEHVSIAVRNLGKGYINGPVEHNTDPYFHERDSTDDAIFSGPLLLLGKGWSKESGFRAAIFNDPAIFPASSMFGLKFPAEDVQLAHAACCVVNSKFAEWFLTVSSARASSYRPEIALDELLRLPIGDAERARKFKAECNSCDFDLVARDLLELKTPDWAIIDDFVDVYLQELRNPKVNRAQARPVSAEIRRYSDYFLRVMESSVGTSGASATIFEPPEHSDLSLRVTAIHLNDVPTHNRITTVDISDDSKLLVMLKRLGDGPGEPSDGARRLLASGGVTRIFDFYQTPVSSELIPTVYIVKPNSLRYWTRTAALDDADAALADLLSWHVSRETRV